MKKINWQERLNQLLSTGKNKSFATGGITILFVVAMSIIGVIPAISSLGQQSEDNQKRDDLISKLDQKLTDLQTLTLAQESNVDIVEYFDTIMPEGEKQEETINFLNSLALKRSIYITNFRFDRDSRELFDNISITYGEKIVPQYLSITTSGDREAILGFMKDVEQSARILDVQDFSINRVPLTDSKGIVAGTTLNLNLKFIIYFYQ